VNLDVLRWECPDLHCESQQARGIPRNLQLDWTGDLAGLTTWREVRESEDQLRAAVEKRRRLDEPDAWKATESVDKEGRKQLNFRNVHFELTEHADQQVERACQRVLAVRRAWAGIDGRGL
jgi:hypothetical protein